MANAYENNLIYSEIQLIRPESCRWELIGEGGFSKIEKADVEYSYAKATGRKEGKPSKPEPILKKTLVRKIEKVRKNKITHEREILNQMQAESCVNISKCYYSKQPGYEEMLFMEFYPYRSLELFLKNHQTTISPITLMFILFQAAQSLRFLKLQKIHHLDVKPANMLIGRNFILRLTDFGESYHPKVCKNDFKPGFTMNYSPPDIYTKKIEFSAALDVFSLGVVESETLFEKHPVDIRKDEEQDKRKLLNFFRGLNDVKMLTSAERVGESGVQCILQLLQHLFLKNMKTNPQQRPLVDWNAVVLRESFDYLDRQY